MRRKATQSAAGQLSQGAGMPGKTVMDLYWIRALEEAESAEARAKALRARFGDGAEARCRSELKRLEPDDPRRRQAQDVQRALRWT